MKPLIIIKNHMTALTTTISRYPISTTYLLAIVIMRILAVEDINIFYDSYNHLFSALLIGFFISICIRSFAETFSIHTFSKQVFLYSLSLLIPFIYYIFARFQNNFETVGWIRTAILCFGFFVAFFWIPSIPAKNIPFYKSFMSGFKAYFITLFFSGILFIGLTFVISAIDTLLIPVEGNVIEHLVTFVFLFFFPLFLLSFVPNFTTADKARIEKSTQGSSFLETLLSYIIIPLSAIFTLILLIYILLNIQSDFWEENLLEPILVSYSIVVINILLLSVTFENAFARWFNRLFPKILIPLVLLQLIASIMKINSQGLTHGRYFVILYGLFALATGIIFSFFSKKYYGIIAVLFLISTLISTLPPFDAFTLSRQHQINLLENTLIQNNMLNNGEVTPRPNLSQESKTQISELTSYLERMHYINAIDWLPDSFNYYEDFTSVFGFSAYELSPSEDMNDRLHYSHMRSPEEVISLDEYTYLLNLSISYYIDNASPTVNTIFNIEDTIYQLTWEPNNNLGQFILRDNANNTLILLDTATYDALSYEEENTRAKLKIIPKQVNLYFESDKLNSLNSDVFVLIQIK